jgi:hypothetical protein
MEFTNRCTTSTDTNRFADLACVQDVYRHTCVDETLVLHCMKESGGLEGDTINTLLEQAIQIQVEKNIVVLPSLLVNTLFLRVAVDAANVFAAICAAFDQIADVPSVCIDCIYSGCDNPVECAATGICTGESSSSSGPGSSEIEEFSTRRTQDVPADPNAEDDPFWDEPPENYYDDPMVGGGDGGVSDMLFALADSLGGVEMCGVDFGEIASAAAASAEQANAGDIEAIQGISIFEPDQKCSDEKRAEFMHAIRDFDACSSGWDIKELIETFPSALVGISLRCYNFYLDILDLSLGIDETPLPPPDDMEECAGSILGNNPLGNALRGLYLYPDQNCPCLESLSEALPECTLDVWPIPLVGSWISASACLMSSIGCDFFDEFCPDELDNLDECLPLLGDDELSCEEISQCDVAGGSLSLSLPWPLSGIPLPDACIRMHEELGTWNNVIGRYDQYRDKCTHASPVWDIQASHDNDLAMAQEDSEESSGSSLVAIIAFTVMFVGLVSAVSIYLARRGRVYDNKTERYATVELAPSQGQFS